MRSRVNNITNRTVAALGIKKLDENLEKSIINIINCNPQYVILGCRDIPITEKLEEALSNTYCPKIIISPFNYRFRNQKGVINEIKFIENFYKNNIGTIINSINESNFILTDKFCYISSGSLNNSGIMNNIELYEIISVNDLNYKLWRDEIFEFIVKEMENYRSNSYIEKNQYILKELINRLKINISNNLNELNKDYIFNLLDIIDNIDRFTMISTDTFQYLNKDFIDLVKVNKKLLAKSSSIKDELFRMLININDEKESANIKIFNCLKDEFMSLLTELERLEVLRDDKYHNSIMPWRKNESIEEFLSVNTTVNNSLIKEFYERIIMKIAL